MVLTVRRALPATSELGTPTPNVFSMLTTSSRASIESSPSPFGPKRGKSSPIWSGVVCSIKFLTSISLMRGRRSTSDINEAREIVVNGGAGQPHILKSRARSPSEPTNHFHGRPGGPSLADQIGLVWSPGVAAWFGSGRGGPPAGASVRAKVGAGGGVFFPAGSRFAP